MVIVDTDILIDAGRGVGDAATCLQEIEHESSLAVSAVTHMELILSVAKARPNSVHWSVS